MQGTFKFCTKVTFQTQSAERYLLIGSHPREKEREWGQRAREALVLSLGAVSKGREGGMAEAYRRLRDQQAHTSITELPPEKKVNYLRAHSR